MPDPSASYFCGACGERASTVTLVSAGRRDPGPFPADAPPGIDMVGSAQPSVSINGGPVSISVWTEALQPDAVAGALASGDAALLSAIDSEFAPFWCPKCGLAYCRDHWVVITRYDDGFFDCIDGTCPRGHTRTLED